MNLFYGITVWVVVGALVGWGATVLTRMVSSRARMRSMILGIVGAVAAGFLASGGVMTRGFFGTDSDSGGLMGNAFVALLGSAALLAIVQLFVRDDRDALHRP